MADLTINVRDLLGADADSLLAHECKTVSKGVISLPGADFIDRVVASLDGKAILTIEDVRAAPFRPRRGGYREDAVDEMLDRVVELLLLIRHEAADGLTPARPRRGAPSGPSPAGPRSGPASSPSSTGTS